MSKLSDLGKEIVVRLLALPEQSLEVRAAIAKAILLNNALLQVKQEEIEVEEKPVEKKQLFGKKKRASKKK